MINGQNLVIVALHATLANGKNPNETESGKVVLVFSSQFSVRGFPESLL